MGRYWCNVHVADVTLQDSRKVAELLDKYREDLCRTFWFYSCSSLCASDNALTITFTEFRNLLNDCKLASYDLPLAQWGILFANVNSKMEGGSQQADKNLALDLDHFMELLIRGSIIRWSKQSPAEAVSAMLHSVSQRSKKTPVKDGFSRAFKSMEVQNVVSYHLKEFSRVFKHFALKNRAPHTSPRRKHDAEQEFDYKVACEDIYNLFRISDMYSQGYTTLQAREAFMRCSLRDLLLDPSHYVNCARPELSFNEFMECLVRIFYMRTNRHHGRISSIDLDKYLGRISYNLHEELIDTIVTPFEKKLICRSMLEGKSPKPARAHSATPSRRPKTDITMLDKSTVDHTDLFISNHTKAPLSKTPSMADVSHRTQEWLSQYSTDYSRSSKSFQEAMMTEFGVSTAARRKEEQRQRRQGRRQGEERDEEGGRQAGKTSDKRLLLLEMGFNLRALGREKMPEYSALLDPNCQLFWGSKSRRRHLQRQGQVDRFGYVLETSDKPVIETRKTPIQWVPHNQRPSSANPSRDSR